MALFDRVYVDPDVEREVRRDTLTHEIFHIARAATDPEVWEWSHTPYDESTARAIGYREEILARLFAWLAWHPRVAPKQFRAMVDDVIANTLETKSVDMQKERHHFLKLAEYERMLSGWLAEPKKKKRRLSEEGSEESEESSSSSGGALRNKRRGGSATAAETDTEP